MENSKCVNIDRFQPQHLFSVGGGKLQILERVTFILGGHSYIVLAQIITE